MPDAPIPLSYCGAPPVPGELWLQWNLDPILIAALLLVAMGYGWAWRRIETAPGRCGVGRREAAFFASGWGIATLAFISPLCSLSVALFSARVGQHMVLTLLAAPLILLGRPERVFGLAAESLGLRAGAGLRKVGRLCASGGTAWITFAVFVWLWHAPGPYAATFASDAVYWAMHLTLLGSSLLLWRVLLGDGVGGHAAAILIGFTTSVHMGLLGALITLAPRSVYGPHAATTWPWGFSPLEDQQLGGLIMWVPGCGLFLIAGIVTTAALLNSVSQRQTAAQES